MRAALFALTMILCTVAATAQQGVSIPPQPAPNLSQYATNDAVAQAVTAAQAAQASQAAQVTKQATIPAAGPGAGLCKQTIVPSEIVTSAGMAGTVGTCSRILQCGTSSAYVVTQFNVGGGC